MRTTPLIFAALAASPEPATLRRIRETAAKLAASGWTIRALGADRTAGALRAGVDAAAEAAGRRGTPFNGAFERVQLADPAGGRPGGTDIDALVAGRGHRRKTDLLAVWNDGPTAAGWIADATDTARRAEVPCIDHGSEPERARKTIDAIEILAAQWAANDAAAA